MPRRSTHAKVGLGWGLLASALVLFAVQQDWLSPSFFAGASSRLDLFVFMVLGTLMARIGSLLPDRLEPGGRNPNHRKFFHSIVFLLALVTLLGCIGGGFILDGASRDLFLLRVFVSFTTMGYLSHLVLDWFTPKGLPVV